MMKLSVIAHARGLHHTVLRHVLLRLLVVQGYSQVADRALRGRRLGERPSPPPPRLGGVRLGAGPSHPTLLPLPVVNPFH